MPYNYDGKDYSPDGFAKAVPGPCRVEIMEAKERDSSAGNEMMEIVCKVIDGKGKGALLWYYVVYSSEYAERQFGRILHSCGLDPKVKRAIRPDMFIGKTAEIEVKVERSEEYGEKPKIAYWRIPAEAQEFSDDGSTDSAEPQDDDIPF
jgi:hypothetical protein